MDNLLSNICDIDPIELVDNKDILNDICTQVKKYYSKIEMGRHSYADVSSLLYKMEEGQYEYLIYNLKTIHDKFEADGNIELQKSTFKLLDHIKLETCREVDVKQAYLNNVTQKISSVISNQYEMAIKKVESKEDELIKNLQKQTEDIEAKFEKHTVEIDKINGNLISVLGIFGAIIVAFFGGLNLLGSVLQNMHSVSIYRLVFISIIVISGLFNVIFLLLYCISKLTQKPLKSNCVTDSKCGDLNNKIVCLYNKYPLVIFFNGTSFWFSEIIFIMYIVDKYNIVRDIVQIMHNIPFIKYIFMFEGISVLLIGTSIVLTSQYIIFKILKKIYINHIKSCFNCNKQST